MGLLVIMMNRTPHIISLLVVGYVLKTTVICEFRAFS